jgi:hypothetical protein
MKINFLVSRKERRGATAQRNTKKKFQTMKLVFNYYTVISKMTVLFFFDFFPSFRLRGKKKTVLKNQNGEVPSQVMRK